MSDWHDECVRSVIKEISDVANITVDQATNVYGFLSEIGLIDYDVEKDILHERYVEEE